MDINVIIDSVRSNLKNIDIGVPEGYILGPLFLILFINDVLINDKNTM